ncbi:coiled-coil-helix-coiled-coil-helix domain-containing protein 5 isoform X1 [Bos indicus]|uniref:Coiled-coil-helix-coiled-coil-helix domain-containing protein 5 isoform X1 n=2 Tax=Bos TaxID=9903 RepID=A0ABM4T496_BOSIN|nr:coiled-coil-helix-coiled-coil-helix domain-containing protein 5 isoform X1 [Bos indicus x Bos taurus]
MQAALEITARYCSRELEQYGQCVAAKPESWQRDCHHLKMSIAQCTSAHPIIRQIRQACSEPFKAFEECLRQNEAAMGNCAEHVRRFLQCAEQVQPTHRPSTLEGCSLCIVSMTRICRFWNQGEESRVPFLTTTHNKQVVNLRLYWNQGPGLQKMNACSRG